MRRIYIDEKEIVWHLTIVDLPDEWSDEKIREYIDEPHDPYEIEDISGSKLYHSEYLYESSEYTGDFEIRDESGKLISCGIG